MKKPDFLYTTDSEGIVYLHPLTKKSREFCQNLKICTWVNVITLEIDNEMFSGIKGLILTHGLTIEKH